MASVDMCSHFRIKEEDVLERINAKCHVYTL